MRFISDLLLVISTTVSEIRTNAVDLDRMSWWFPRSIQLLISARTSIVRLILIALLPIYHDRAKYIEIVINQVSRFAAESCLNEDNAESKSLNTFFFSTIFDPHERGRY